MKHLCLFLFIFLITAPVFSQHFTFGFENGINFSNLRQSQGNTHYAAQPGPVNGIFAKYEPVQWLVLQSGVNFTSFYFNQNVYSYYYPDYYYWLSPSSYQPTSSMIAPTYFHDESKFSFLRLPLLVKFKTQGRLSTEFGGGAYYAVLTNDEFRGKDKDIRNEEYQNEQFPPMNDWGWIMAGSLNYRVTGRWNIFASGQITTVHETYIDNVEGKIGSTEFTFGVGYKPFKNEFRASKNDSANQKMKIIPHAGINISSTRSTENKDKYLSSTALSMGVSVNFPIGPNVSLLTGSWFEQKGYGLNYNGNYSFIYLPPKEFETQNPPSTISDVSIDYLTFPFMFDFAFGKKLKSNISFGAYYSWLQNAFSQGERIVTNNYGQGYQVMKEYFTENQEQWFKTSDAGFMLGYRLEIPVFRWGSIFVAANRSLGAVDILKNIDDLQTLPQFSIEDKMYNRSTTVMMGLTIPVTQK
ncbi:MAG: hypothetical protein FD181_2553 [Prolixibacteraceae bacterium]|nr:MAG: hypothetical protein FD181_2553 [Prolixibacteraceae bacterium]